VKRAISVVGIGADGCGGLSSRAIGAIASARVLAGGERQLAYFPQFQGERIRLDRSLDAALDRVVALADEAPVCVLASGDPLFFGVGAALLERLPAQDLEIIPHPTAVQWAFARAGLPWDDAALISLHGRGREGLAARLRHRAKAALLTDGLDTPPVLARHLLDHGERTLRAVLCEELGGPGERIRSLTLEELAALSTDDVRPLNVLLLLRPEGWHPPSVIPALPDDRFERRRGLITKREVRVLALAALGLRARSVVWDVGAGSGSVAVEAALISCEGRVYAVERDPECAELCRRNARAHGADNLRLVEGAAPEALRDLPAPDAVFVGGSGGALREILTTAASRLRPGGRLVISAVTLETLEEARRALGGLGLSPEVTLIQVARSAPIAGRTGLTRLEPLSPVHLVSATVPAGGAA
jgi:precorrin-6Y C5,15-methyltransferase (decarboxylating)